MSNGRRRSSSNLELRSPNFRPLKRHRESNRPPTPPWHKFVELNDVPQEKVSPRLESKINRLRSMYSNQEYVAFLAEQKFMQSNSCGSDGRGKQAISEALRRMVTVKLTETDLKGLTFDHKGKPLQLELLKAPKSLQDQMPRASYNIDAQCESCTVSKQDREKLR